MFKPSAAPDFGRRRIAQWFVASSPLLTATLHVATARAEVLTSLPKGTSMKTPHDAVFKWDVDFCSYGLDIDPRASSRVETLPSDNVMWDAQGLEVARFYSGLGAAWGFGSDLMGGPDRNGAKLPQRLQFTYYDYLEDRFYQLKTELPIEKLFELFSQPGLARANYKARPKYQTLRIGVAPLGNVMVWAAGYTDNQVELGHYRAEVMEGMTPKRYNASGVRPFPLREDRWQELSGGRAKPATIERIMAGWVPDPSYYMRRLRVKFPWRLKLTGAVSRVTDILCAESNAESSAYGAWEMGLYQTVNTMRAPPSSAVFWFHDFTGKRHYLWLEFWKRERAVSEADLTEVFAAFEQVFGKRNLEDNLFVPGDADMATVEVQVGEDFKTIHATLVKGAVRVPLPVGRRQHFELEPFAYWSGNPTPAPDVIKLFQDGPAKTL